MLLAEMPYNRTARCHVASDTRPALPDPPQDQLPAARRDATAADGGAASRAATAEPRGAVAACARAQDGYNQRAADCLGAWRRTQALALAPPALACSALRCFGSGTYLDKAQVTERVLNVVKNFAKVDPAKARAHPGCALWREP